MVCNTARSLALGILLTTGLHIAPAYADFKPLVTFGYDFGGEKLVHVEYTDGDTADIKTNQGFRFGAGTVYVNEAGNFETELSVSYKVDRANGSNGHVAMSRFPVDWLAFYRAKQVRIGAGLTYHLSPKLTGSGVAENIEAKFKNALGLIVQADFIGTKKSQQSGPFLGFRYTFLTYKEKETNTPIDADGPGIHFGYRF